MQCWILPRLSRGIIYPAVQLQSDSLRSRCLANSLNLIQRWQVVRRMWHSNMLLLGSSSVFIMWTVAILLVSLSSDLLSNQGLNWIGYRKTIEYAIYFSIEFCSTVGYPVKLNGNLNRKCIQYPIEMSPSIVYNQEGIESQGFEIELGIRIASNP